MAEDGLHLARLSLDLARLSRWAAERALIPSVTGTFDEGYALHKLLTECFGRAALQPFRLIAVRGGKAGTVYAYASGDAATLMATAHAVAPPEHLEVLELTTLKTKRMPDKWQAGQRLGFDVRVRPIRRTSNRGEWKQAGERDAFLHEALSRPNGEMSRLGRTREQVYGDWLAEQLHRHGGGYLDGPVRLAAFRHHRSVRSDGRRGPEGPDAVMHGTIRITDGETFNRLLARGLGRHRAYGYGMILLRPPQPMAGG